MSGAVAALRGRCRCCCQSTFKFGAGADAVAVEKRDLLPVQVPMLVNIGMLVLVPMPVDYQKLLPLPLQV